MEEEFSLDIFFFSATVLPRNDNLKVCATSFSHSVYGLGDCVWINHF